MIKMIKQCSYCGRNFRTTDVEINMCVRCMNNDIRNSVLGNDLRISAGLKPRAWSRKLEKEIFNIVPKKSTS